MMLDHTNWSVSLGRWNGLHVRVHMFFLLFVVFTIFLSWTGSSSELTDRVDWLATQMVAILFVSVLLHELGHVFAANRLGGYVDEIVIGPHGGMGSLDRFFDGRSELYAYLAGPLVNLAICLVCLPVILATSGNVLGLLHPIAPVGLQNSPSVEVFVRLTFWINWVLLLLNLLPVFPFDGGRIARAAICMRWPVFSRQNAITIVAGIAKLAAIAIIVAAVLMNFDNTHHVVPTRFALILFAIFLYFSAKHEPTRESTAEIEDGEYEEDLVFGYDFSQGYTSLEQNVDEGHPPSGPLKRWIDERKVAKVVQQRQQEEDEDRQMDEILERVHDLGLDSLTDDERAFLDRVSDRYRRRLSDDVV